MNTSGVFKACHKGFGGHGRDALGRILAPIRLRLPELLDGPPAEAGCQEAADFARGRPADLCYLDPPYNQHQYGSNYHLLNTIALWDRPAVSGERRADGRLERKAGIREDWVRTRSAYCYRSSASAALAGLLEAVDARYLVLSYNTEGLIPFEELAALLEGQGELELYGSGYVKYRGGRQSIGRQVHNVELALVLDRGRPSSPASAQRRRRFHLEQRLGLLLRGAFQPERVAAVFPVCSAGITVRLAGGELLLPMRRLHRFEPEAATALSAAIGRGRGAGRAPAQAFGLRLPGPGRGAGGSGRGAGGGGRGPAGGPGAAPRLVAAAQAGPPQTPAALRGVRRPAGPAGRSGPLRGAVPRPGGGTAPGGGALRRLMGRRAGRE